MIAADILHCFHLGLARDLAASVIKQLASNRRSIWQGSNIDRRLAFASASLKAWAKQKRLTLRLKGFSKKNLGWSSEE